MSLDQFYTTRKTSTRCVKELLKIIKESNIDISDFIFIEPSAGDGSFVDALCTQGIDRERIIAYDIEPHRDDILSTDWLMMHNDDIKTGSSPIIIIGNPPFGPRSATAKRFISHSIAFNPMFIAFILPDTFARLTNQKCFGEYRLIRMGSLAEDFFMIDNEKYHVPCTFFILTNNKTIFPCVDLKDKQVAQPSEYSFLPMEDSSADFVINGNSGRVRELADVTNPKSEHYIKVSDGYNVARIRDIFATVSYDRLSSCNGGNWWINRNDINKAFLKATSDARS